LHHFSSFAAKRGIAATIEALLIGGIGTAKTQQFLTIDGNNQLPIIVALHHTVFTDQVD
jgi:hypothetical protein